MFVVILSTCFPLPFVVLRRWMVSMIEPPPPPPQPRAARRIMRIAAKSRGGRGCFAIVPRAGRGRVAGASRGRVAGGGSRAGGGRVARRGAGRRRQQRKNNNDARRETRIRPRRGSVRPLGPSLYHLSKNLSLKISLHISLNPIPSEVGIGKILLKISVVI